MADLATIAGLQSPGDSIRERRIELSWTQGELSEHSGISQADISRIENGRLDPRWSTIHRLSTALESTTADAVRNLTNGHRNRLAPKPTGATWTPKGTVLPIDFTDR